jgi:MFS family permease
MRRSANLAPPTRLAAVARDSATRAVVALGITQIVAWGTTLYALGVLGKPIASDTGWPQGVVYGGLSIGLLTASAVSAPMGHLIDRRGGLVVMTSGSGLAALGLALLSNVSNPYAYCAVWALLGLAMRMTLYDAAFAALVQVTPSRGRRAISYLTLFGGFASTLFWPIGHMLNAASGWRSTLLAFAALNLIVCLPLNAWGLRHREGAGLDATADRAAMTSARPILAGRAYVFAMALFGLVLAICAFVFGALSVHLVPLIEASGIGVTAAVTLASMKGLAQVGGRIAEIAFGKNLEPMNLGRISVVVLPLSFAILMGTNNVASALAFTLLFGLSNGLVTIVRGAVPLALFGQKGYGTVLGVLATPYLLLSALAPATFAFIVDAYGYRVAGAVLFVCALLALSAMELLAFWYRRQRL